MVLITSMKHKRWLQTLNVAQNMRRVITTERKTGFCWQKGWSQQGESNTKRKKWDSIPCQFGDDYFIWFIAFNASHQHVTNLSIATHTAGQVHFLSGNGHVFFFLEPSQVLAPHKAGSAKTSCALLLQPAVCVSETSVKQAQLIYRSWGVC